MTTDFVDLHVHTMYSLLDGLMRPKELVIKTKALGRSAVAITDHGSVGGFVDFHKAATKEKIKPILGCEFYYENGDGKIWITKAQELIELTPLKKGFEKEAVELTVIGLLKIRDVLLRDPDNIRKQVSIQ